LAIKKHVSEAPEATESDLKSNTTPKCLKMTLKVCDGFRPIYRVETNPFRLKQKTPSKGRFPKALSMGPWSH